jgi:antitoxin component YwqK of YwqJK toxin-antitoxin module
MTYPLNSLKSFVMTSNCYKPLPFKTVPRGQHDEKSFSVHGQGSQFVFYKDNDDDDDNPEPYLVQSFNLDNQALLSSTEVVLVEGALVKHGVHKEYGTETGPYPERPLGMIMLEAHYHMGKLDGRCVESNHINKEIITKTYKDNQLDGRVTRFDAKTGYTTLKVDYKGGKRHGIWKEFNTETGKITTKAHYENDALVDAAQKRNPLTGKLEPDPSLVPHESWCIFGKNEANDAIPNGEDNPSHNISLNLPHNRL